MILEQERDESLPPSPSSSKDKYELNILYLNTHIALIHDTYALENAGPSYEIAERSKREAIQTAFGGSVFNIVEVTN